MKRLIAAIATIVLGGCAQLPGATPAGAIPASTPDTALPSVVPGVVASLTNPVIVGLAGSVYLSAREGIFHLTASRSLASSGPMPESVVRLAIASDADSLIAVGATDAETIVLSRSTDAGASWKPSGTTQIATEGGIAEVSAAISGTRLVVLANETSGSNFSYGSWAASSDNGQKWATGGAPSGGKVSAAGGSFWIVGGVTGSDVYVSDSGENWGKVDLPLDGSFTAESPTTVAGFGAVLPVTIHSSKRSEIAFLASDDGGKTWKEVGSAPAPITEDGTTIPTAVDTSGTWVAVWPDGSKVLTGKFGEPDIDIVSPNGLQENVMGVAMSEDALVALAAIQTCPSGKSSCTSTVVLEVSTDRGQTWSILN